MRVDQHSNTSQWLHDFYLCNRSVAELSYDLECMLYPKTTTAEHAVFVTGLARSGTTSVLNYIFDTGEYASLIYSDMPFILMPNIWGKHNYPSKKSKKERFHGDNILVSADSPEALSEFFWKTLLKDSYITTDSLRLHDLHSEHLTKFEKYVSLICSARSKSKFISKNNNNILRLKSLIRLSIPNIFIMLYRHPIEHAGSLMKMHIKFSEKHKEDPFALRYFNYLGHHEFGLNQKPFYLDSKIYEQMISLDKTNFDYWLLTWLNYYNYVIKHHINDVIFISFKDICEHPLKVYQYINDQLKIDEGNIQFPEPYIPPVYDSPVSYSENLLKECLTVYEQLNLSRNYI